MALDSSWFSDVFEDAPSAFSLKVTSKLHEEQSPFQKIEVYQTRGWGRMLAIDGIIMLTERENFLYHEMLAHPALYAHPQPRRVLIIGGGDCGTLHEVLKHPGVERVVQCDIDEAVTRAAVQFFPALTESNADARAELVFEDGVKYVEDSADGSWDLVIVDSTDPFGPSTGLFAEPFLRQVVRVLAADGLYVQQSESPMFQLEDCIVPMHRNLRAAGFAEATELHFPQPVYQSGWWSAAFAAKRAGGTHAFDAARESAQPFVTDYYNADIHRAALAQPNFVRRALAAVWG
ncbi:polyamine aminopropyltransferase [Plasticicumulans acidivorans]|uniref:Polyamine aminopropyltransferase n=1 Tax=Plasticicumulans acidivorans TaxID=886464 RepID=A0A317MZZ5_9GAMM|nr:polyamine aminopropyltransferase [Plasticicumulans acidivorans]PWV64882.1 spermidine synthase [Plasticicumulans acidivorans]